MPPRALLKHRFQNSLDMIAARSMCNYDRAIQSGTGNAWCIVDSPTLGKMSSSPRRGDIALKLEESTMASGSGLAGQAVSVAPLNIRKNIKKIRRRGLVSGVHLDLPPSPKPSGSPPQTAITFTAEWDLSQNTFVFTPFDSASPSYPFSAATTQFSRSPIPQNVDEDSLPFSPALSSPSVYSQSVPSPRHPGLAAIQTAWNKQKDAAGSMTSSLTPDSSNSSPSTPVSVIFDRESLYSHSRSRNLSQSTAASSVMDLPSLCGPKAEEEHEALASLTQDLSRSLPVIAGSDADKECYRGMDKVLLLEPMCAFEQTLWDTTKAEPCDIRRTKSVRSIRPRRPHPDVPRSAESTMSTYSIQESVSPLDTHLPARSSLRQQLHTQISKTFFSAVFLKR